MQNDINNQLKHEIDIRWFTDLLAEHQAPCVSVYVPLHRAAPPADQNPILYRDLLDKAEEQMLKRYDLRTVRQMIQKLESIAPGPEFWVGNRDAIAVFASPDFVRVIDLLETVKPHVAVADTFHIKPLLRILQKADRYQVLCLELKNVQMFEGNPWKLEKLSLRYVPRDLWEVAGMTLSHDGTSAIDLLQAPKQASEGSAPIEPASEEIFYHAVDRAIWEHYSRPSGLPLILCADERTNVGFRQHAKNPYLLEQTIMWAPRSQPTQRIHEEAWKILQPIYQRRIEKLADDFRTAKAHQKGSDEPLQVAEAASHGRIGTLLIDADKRIPAHLARYSGMIQPTSPGGPTDDMLDDLGEMVLRAHGQVLVVPSNAMPTDTGVAAIYRY